MPQLKWIFRTPLLSQPGPTDVSSNLAEHFPSSGLTMSSHSPPILVPQLFADELPVLVVGGKELGDLFAGEGPPVVLDRGDVLRKPGGDEPTEPGCDKTRDKKVSKKSNITACVLSTTR